jgi:hypothetical protein
MKNIKTIIKVLIILFIISQAAAQVHIHSCNGEFDQASNCLLCNYLYISLSTLVLLFSGFIILLQIGAAGKIVFIAPIIYVFKNILRNKAPPVFNYNFS